VETKDVVTVIALVLAGACALWCFATLLNYPKPLGDKPLHFVRTRAHLTYFLEFERGVLNSCDYWSDFFLRGFFHCSEFGPGLGNRPRFSSRRLRYLAWQFSSLLYF